MKRPWIVIPAHNRRELTLGCLATLRANRDLDFCQAVVVDDGSSDGTGKAIRARFPEVLILDGNGSLFWTGAIAYAMTHDRAREATGPLFWLNDDCRPRPTAIHTLTEFLTQQPRAVVGPRCVDAATNTAVATGFAGRKTLASEPGSTRRVAGLSGFCVGIGSEVWRELGPPDALRFPHYGGDTAYSLLAGRRGFPVLMVGDAVVELVDHDPSRPTLAARVRADESFRANWRRILLATNSPHRLRTLFALQRLKYGVVLGSALGAARAAEWSAQLAWRLLRR